MIIRFTIELKGGVSSKPELCQRRSWLFADSFLKRKAWDLNPHDPVGAARFSKPARRTVSGYLPIHSVDPLGIEPRSLACRASVVPLDYEPASGASGNRTPISWLQAKRLPVRPTSHRSVSLLFPPQRNEYRILRIPVTIRFMRLPKFWRDCGQWNDLLVQGAIVLSICAWGGLAFAIGSPWLGLATILLGPITGLFVGFLLIHVLCTYFCKN